MCIPIMRSVYRGKINTFFFVEMGHGKGIYKFMPTDIQKQHRFKLWTSPAYHLPSPNSTEKQLLSFCISTSFSLLPFSSLIIIAGQE